ncbi:hypothetical protein COAQ111491_14770 [Comamonas aquatilis]
MTSAASLCTLDPHPPSCRSCFGAWTLLDQNPRIVAEERFISQMELDMRSNGLIARNNQQSAADVPRS